MFTCKRTGIPPNTVALFFPYNFLFIVGFDLKSKLITYSISKVEQVENIILEYFHSSALGWPEREIPFILFYYSFQKYKSINWTTMNGCTIQIHSLLFLFILYCFEWWMNFNSVSATLQFLGAQFRVGSWCLRGLQFVLKITWILGLFVAHFCFSIYLQKKFYLD